MNALVREPAVKLSPVGASAVEEVGGALRALRRGLLRSKGFSIHVAVCDSRRQRDRLIDSLVSTIPAPIHRVDVNIETRDVLDVFQEAGYDGDGPVMLVGFDELLDQPARAERFLDALNLGREEWPDTVPGPVVFWVSQASLGRLISGAPDFFDWRSDTLFFPDTADDERFLGKRTWSYGVDPRLSGAERDERIRELEARVLAMREVSDHRVLPTIVDWLDELADLRFARGETDEALRIRRDGQLPIVARLGDDRLRAWVMSKIASILQARGEINEAVRIRRNEELPIYEQFGDVRSRAITMSQIADAVLLQGDIDQAMRIQRNEVVPVLERLGDARERAIAMGKIADILQARGEIDEALRIRREDELPVFERLGDVREHAITLGKIADILRIRGDDEGALMIYRDEQLPMFERLGNPRLRAIAMSRIADILQSRGETAEALRIRREEELPAFEQSGDVRSYALALGDIADLLRHSGDADEALRLRTEEQIPLLEQMDDVREHAFALGEIADMLLARGEADKASGLRLTEQLPLVNQFGDERERSMALQDIAVKLLSATGRTLATTAAACELLKGAFHLAKAIGDAQGIAGVGLQLVDVLSAMDRKDDARQVLADVESTARQLDDKEALARVTGSRARLEN